MELETMGELNTLTAIKDADGNGAQYESTKRMRQDLYSHCPTLYRLIQAELEKKKGAEKL